jgi:hypothetical protein
MLKREETMKKKCRLGPDKNQQQPQQQTNNNNSNRPGRWKKKMRNAGKEWKTTNGPFQSNKTTFTGQKREEASVFNCFHDAIRPFSFPFLLTYTLFHLCRHSRHHGPNEHRRRCRRLSFFSVKYFAHSSRSLLFFYCLDVHILLGR